MSADVAAFVRDKLGHEPARPRAVRARAHPLQRRQATATSVWNSSATGCSAWSSRAPSTNVIPNEPEGNLSQTLQRAGRSRDLRRERPRNRRARDRAAGQAGARGPRERERQCRRGRRRGVDRRLVPRRRPRGRGALHPRICGNPTWPSSGGRHSIPKSALQELAAARGLKAPVYEVVSRTGAHHAPKFTVRVSVPTLGEATAEGASKQEAETAAAAALLSQLK